MTSANRSANLSAVHSNASQCGKSRSPFRNRALLSLVFVPLNFAPAHSFASLSAAVTDVCESRRTLTQQESDKLAMFNAELSWLQSYRSGADQRGTTYKAKFEGIIGQNEGKFSSDELKDAATELILFEEFQQLLFTTVGLENPEFKELQRVLRSTEFFSGGTPREIREATLGMQKRVTSWSQNQLSKINVARTNAEPSSNGAGIPAKNTSGHLQSNSNETQAALNIETLSQTENILASLNVVNQFLTTRMERNGAQLDDKMASYRQYFFSLFGGTAVVGTLVASAPIVSTASAGIGAAGVVLAGCGIGAAGGGAAALLQRQYQSYADAWIASANHHTSYACELRRAVENNHESLFAAFRDGAMHGAIAGCAFTGAGMIAPQLTVYGVTSAVALATGAEGVMASKDAYMATRTYLIYRSLISLQKAELSAEHPEIAAQYLQQAQEYSKTAGAHALNVVLVGIVLVGGPKEIQHAIAHGREAIVALIGKSSDNAAVAVNLASSAISQASSSTPPSSSLQSSSTSSNSAPALPTVTSHRL